MAVRYYDDIITAKLQNWIPEAANLRVLKPEETKRFFELTAEDNADQKFMLPLIAVTRDPDIELLHNMKTLKSFDGLRLDRYIVDSDGNQVPQDPEQSLLFNVIPIRLEYKIDIYTKKAEEGDEYLRNFLFKLINNPTVRIEIPYNGSYIQHIANLRVHSTVSDTSAISERIFSGQFTRWTIGLEVQDAFLFNIPYKTNWKLHAADLELVDRIEAPSEIEVEPLGISLDKLHE